MTDFHNVSFPLALAFGARGGPVRRTDVTRLASGAEYRNTPHARSRREYDAGAGVKTLEDVHLLTAFFEARHGQRFAFRFRDPMDHMSGLPGSKLSVVDQEIGTGDGLETAFQLVKTYADIENTYVRPITKPVAGTVLLAVDGVPEPASVNELTGSVTFDTPPAAGTIITAGFQFDVPVRFGTDRLDISLENSGTGRIGSIPLVEVINHA